MQASRPIEDRPPQHGKCPFGRNRTFQHARIPGRPAANPRILRVRIRRLAFVITVHYPPRVHQHGLNHETVVVIVMIHRSVAVLPVADIPIVRLPESVIGTHQVGPLARHAQERLDRGAEHQPIIIRRPRIARSFQLDDHPPLRQRVESAPQPFRRTQESLGQKRRIDQRLAVTSEIQIIGRRTVHRIPQSGVRPGQQLVPHSGFRRRNRIAGHLEPRSQTAQQTSHCLQMRILLPSGPVVLFDGHVPPQRAGRQVRQHGFRHTVSLRSPVLTVRLRLPDGSLPARHRKKAQKRHD